MESIIKNKANRFWLYLVQRNKKVFTKDELNESYREFQEMWNEKKNDFEYVFGSLRKTRIKYIFKKKWYVLSKEEFENLKNNKFEEYELIFKFLENQKIPFYIGLSSAKYLNQLTWQSLKVVYIINTEFKLKRKIRNIEVRLIKLPKELFINMALKKTNNGIPYSNTEKTLLDETYYLKYKNKKSQISDYNINELNIENVRAYLGFYSRYKKVKKEITNLLTKIQVIREL
jgi:hypothetical protein